MDSMHNNTSFSKMAHTDVCYLMIYYLQRIGSWGNIPQDPGFIYLWQFLQEFKLLSYYRKFNGSLPTRQTYKSCPGSLLVPSYKLMIFCYPQVECCSAPGKLFSLKLKPLSIFLTILAQRDLHYLRRLEYPLLKSNLLPSGVDKSSI